MVNKYFTLNTGAQIPAVGFGTFANEGAKGETYNAVMCALRTGYRHLDCAWFYQNEDEVGNAITDFLAESKGEVKRGDIFVCTKVWNHMHEPADVEWSLKNSLENLKLEYIDLFLIHWPIAAKKNGKNMPATGEDGKYVIDHELTRNFEPTWRAMESLQKNKLTKAIGVSNFTIPNLEKLYSFATIPPAVNQVEIHPFFPNTELLNYATSHNHLLVAYSPLGSQNQIPTTGERVAENTLLNEVAKEKGCSLAQVCIAWGVKRGYPVLPKSGNEKRIQSNFVTVELTDEEFAKVEEVARTHNTRFVNMKDTFGYNVWPEESS